MAGHAVWERGHNRGCCEAGVLTRAACAPVALPFVVTGLRTFDIGWVSLYLTRIYIQWDACQEQYCPQARTHRGRDGRRAMRDHD